jgi:putative ABC transport system permease protein
LFWEYLRIAARVLSAHKFRSALTVLSITIGAFSIVVMSSLADSGLTTLARGLEDIGGARLIDVGAKKPERGDAKRISYFRGITVTDGDALFAALPHIEEKTMWSSLWRRDMISDTGQFSRSDLVAADGGFLALFKMRLAKGRGFSEDENRQHAKVCVIGHKTAEKLFGEVDALGRWVTTQGTRCRVIGQLADQPRWGINFGFDWLDVLVVPVNTLADVEPTVMPAIQITMKTDSATHNEAVKRILNALLVERHHNVDDFEIFDFSTFMNKFDAMFATMKAIVGFIAGIALLVGGVGVMNMMLVSVSERVREIGIRKAIGASPLDISAQFLLEAIVLAGSGGLIGTLAGIGGAVLSGAVIGHFNKTWVSIVAHDAVIAALVVSVGVGVVFGFFPARRAGRLSAIEAMRR